MKTIKPDTYTQTEKLICDWSDKKSYFVHYRMLKFFVRHGMVVDKIHEIISFRPSKWLEKKIKLNTEKRNQAVNDFERDFCKLLNNAFYSMTMENVRNCSKMEFIKEDETDKILKRQSKLISIEFINHMRIVIVLHSSKMKYSWINQFIADLLYWN